MKFKLVCAVAASVALLASNAYADSNDQRSQRYERNNSNSSQPSAQKVKRDSDMRQQQGADMRWKEKSSHPVHRSRMGDH